MYSKYSGGTSQKYSVYVRTTMYMIAVFRQNLSLL